MGFKFVTSDDEGRIYAVLENGDLLYYRDESRAGQGLWAYGGLAQKIGSGWGDFLNVFAGGDGIIYAVAPDGGLLFYRDEARDGTPQWSFGGVGQKIGDGFGSFQKIFSGGDGIIYAIALNGDLYYYRDEARNGTAKWSYGGVGQQIGNGWGNFRQIISGGNGILYAVNNSGDLLFYRDEARDGTGRWSFGGVARKIGQGWENFSTILSGGDGIIYAITPDGFLLFYRDKVRDGTGIWANNGVGQQIGAGWFISAQAASVEGYCRPLSVCPGETIEFMISASIDYEITYMRLGRTQDGDIAKAMTAPISVKSAIQSVPAEAWKTGCGWRISVSLDVPVDWPSGVYAARCSGGDDSIFYIVFIVKPSAEKRNKIAVLANTNTWNAYNSWGGRSKYDLAPVGSFERPNPSTTPIDDGQVNHLTRAELWVLDWLAESGYEVDIYSDLDFHTGIAGLENYHAIILSTHPEYWTIEMMDNLREYLSAGGSLLYLGGNGLFERCEFNQEANALAFWGGDPSQGRDRNYFRNMSPPRPERAILGVAFVYNNYLTVSPPSPYRIEMAEHRLFNGTGLVNGELVGQTGLNGAASGWEIDISDPGAALDGTITTAWAGNDRGSPPANIQVLARGTNQPVQGASTAHMTYYDTDAGGFVFAAGSLCFGGSLVQDKKLQAILTNAINAAVAQ